MYNLRISSPNLIAQPGRYLWTALRPAGLQRVQPWTRWLSVTHPDVIRGPLKFLDSLFIFPCFHLSGGLSQLVDHLFASVLPISTSQPSYSFSWYTVCPGKKPMSLLPSKPGLGTSLVAQWLRICLPMQGDTGAICQLYLSKTWTALVWEDPTCRGATRPVSHNYWACTSGACALKRERPRWWKVRAPRWRVAPACCN